MCITCILPPYILREVAEHGSHPQRTIALQTLAADSSFRIERSETSAGARRASGTTLMAIPEARRQRVIFDTKQTTQLPGTPVRSEDDPPVKDVAVNEVFDNLGITYDFFFDVFGRQGIDGHGGPLHATVHFGTRYANAFWNGFQMVFGDGDGKLFERFTGALDIIGHELTHGVTQKEARLRYSNQSGALNESISDVFGSLIKQRARGQQAHEADWLIGVGVFGPTISGEAVRSLKAPGTAYDDKLLGKDPQPAHMAQYVNTVNDSGGVHINSGIPNHAFYLAATTIGGPAWERAGQIWYDTLIDSRLRPTSGFRAFARICSQHAARRFGKASKEHDAVRAAWQQVGLPVRE
jgi:Zn-dependent metalloprotease